MSSLLPLVDACDNFRIHTSPDPLVPFFLTRPEPGGPPPRHLIGVLRPPILQALKDENARSETLSLPQTWTITPQFVSFSDGLATPAERSAAIKEMLERWHTDPGHPFANVIGGRLWRAELLPVYKEPFCNLSKENIVFEMERSACPLFGIVTYGVHLTIYTEDWKIWVPTRSKTKQTFPGMLDNTVAGGIPSGMLPLDALVKECMEEASLEEDVVRPLIKNTGAISYFYQTAKGWLQPDVQYVYDLCIPADPTSARALTPRPLDGEVEAFELCSFDEVLKRLRAGLFKPNCGLVLIDFLIRHGYLSPEVEPNFLEPDTIAWSLGLRVQGEPRVKVEKINVIRNTVSAVLGVFSREPGCSPERTGLLSGS